MPNTPIQIEVLRGEQVESRHSVSAVLSFRNQDNNESFGQESLPVFPRSTIKPIQALPLILSGAADHFKVSDAELALACASHQGEPIHIHAIQQWLSRMGINESYLECGGHLPQSQESLHHLALENISPGPIYNNCSGKHTGMLATALYLNESTKNYVTLDHPVQQRLITWIEMFSEIKLNPSHLGIDGCSIPAPCIPLKNLALAFSKFSAPFDFEDSVAKACHTLFSSFVKFPILTSGTAHFCSQVMIESHKPILVKSGAEGVMVAAIPDLQLGIALKAHDGNSRASELALAQLLLKLDLIDKNSLLLKPKVKNCNGIETGFLRVLGL